MTRDWDWDWDQDKRLEWRVGAITSDLHSA